MKTNTNQMLKKKIQFEFISINKYYFMLLVHYNNPGAELIADIYFIEVERRTRTINEQSNIPARGWYQKVLSPCFWS